MSKHDDWEADYNELYNAVDMALGSGELKGKKTTLYFHDEDDGFGPGYVVEREFQDGTAISLGTCLDVLEAVVLFYKSEHKPLNLQSRIDDCKRIIEMREEDIRELRQLLSVFESNQSEAIQ